MSWLASAVGVPLAADRNPERTHQAADFFGVPHQRLKHGSRDVARVDGDIEEERTSAFEPFAIESMWWNSARLPRSNPSAMLDITEMVAR